MKVRILGMAALVLLVGCSSTADDSAATSTTLAATTTSTAPTTTVPPTVVTVVEEVPAPEMSSLGQVRIGSTSYEFAFECWAAGAGDVLALGVGTDPETEAPTEAIVQAFLGQPYVAVVVDQTDRFELAVDRQAELFVQGNTISGSALRFVHAGDAAGEGTALGLGSVSILCDGFALGLPEGFTSGADEDAETDS